VKPVLDAGALFTRLGEIRSSATAFTTTWFASREQADAWIRRERLFSNDLGGCLLLLRRDRDFHHLYHWSASEEALNAALPTIPGDGTLTADLVQRALSGAGVAQAYSRVGFRKLRTLVRMSCATARLVSAQPVDERVVVATRCDAPDVLHFLEALLEPHADQIPELDELELAADRRTVFIVRDGDAVAGVLFFELHGQTAILRYWWIGSQYRGQGIGAMLIRAMFRACAATRQTLLWVVDDNVDAITKYEHYGFRRDGLVDHIMIRVGS
jgi:RimJ/RimL family protein N-acetyltransferase